MQTASRHPQGMNPEHMHCPELFPLPLTPADDDRGALPTRGTHALGCSKQMPAYMQSSPYSDQLRCWIWAQKARTGPS